jgi:hypothetical protein
MHASRFDTLASRSPTAAGSRRRALSGLLTGTLALMSGRSSGEAGTKKRKKKRSPTCPEPTDCPTPNTCPNRTCCRCSAASPAGAGCRLARGATTADLPFQVCAEVCGGEGYVTEEVGRPPPGYSVACSFEGPCVLPACPLI